MRLPTALALAVALLAVAGCGADGSGSAGGSPSGDAVSSATIPPSPSTPTAASRSATASVSAAPVPEVLKFTGTTLDGKRFDGTTLAGKPVVLWFWAPWCPTCRAQAAETAKVAAAHRGRVAFVGVGGLDKLPKMRDFVAQNGLAGFPHLTDEAGEVWKRFGVVEQSTYVVLDAKGGTVYRGVLRRGDGLSDRIAGLAR